MTSRALKMAFDLDPVVSNMHGTRQSKHDSSTLGEGVKRCHTGATDGAIGPSHSYI